MPQISATIQDNGTFAALNNMRSLQPIANGLLAWGNMLKTEQGRQPAQTHHAQPFRSVRSRNWFFWALKQGVISVPYQRTRNFTNSWEVSPSGANGLTVDVGTPLAHAPLLKSERMAMYHRVQGYETAAFTTQRTATRGMAYVHAGVAEWVG
jgi:hypothetical protein